MSKVLGVKKENNNLAELLSCQAEECRGSGRKNWLFANTPLGAKAKGHPEILLPWNAPESCRAKSTKTIE